VHQAIQKKRLGMPSKIILLHDSARLHAANLMKVTLVVMGWEIMNHPPYGPGLAPSDFYLFGPIKALAGGQKLHTDDRLKHGVLNWLQNQNKTCYTPGISNLPG
jgi:histone-lysine N-methyltransferase SETMAR